MAKRPRKLEPQTPSLALSPSNSAKSAPTSRRPNAEPLAAVEATRGFLHIPAKRCNPGFPLPLLSVFLDHMQVGEVQINGGGTQALMAEDLLNGSQ
jgi:hypothetical protein